MNCTRCGHPHGEHLLQPDERCRVRIGYGFDPKTGLFEHTAPCRCPGYRGVRPGGGECPHEYLKHDPKCVHCGHMASTWEKKQ